MSQATPEQMLAAMQEMLIKTMNDRFAIMESRLASSAEDLKRKNVGRDVEMPGMHTPAAPAQNSSGIPPIVEAQSFLNEKASALHAQHDRERHHPTSHEHHVALLEAIRESLASGQSAKAATLIETELSKDRAARAFGWDYVSMYFKLSSAPYCYKLANAFGTGESYDEVAAKAAALGSPLSKPLAKKETKSAPGSASSAKPAKAKKSDGKKSFRKGDGSAKADKPAKTGGKAN